MINNTLPPAPIEDKDCRLTFCVDGIVYAVNTLSEEEREECKAKLNKHSGRTFEWVVEHGGERHWVLYDTAMYHKEHSTLTYIDSCTLAPTIPINATSCYQMFRGCEYVNLSAFNTENIIEMSYMFEHYKGETLDVSKFHTAKTVNMYGMFADCHNLQRLDVGNFNPENGLAMTRFTLSSTGKFQFTLTLVVSSEFPLSKMGTCRKWPSFSSSPRLLKCLSSLSVIMSRVNVFLR